MSTGKNPASPWKCSGWTSLVSTPQLPKILHHPIFFSSPLYLASRRTQQGLSFAPWFSQQGLYRNMGALLSTNHDTMTFITFVRLQMSLFMISGRNRLILHKHTQLDRHVLFEGVIATPTGETQSSLFFHHHHRHRHHHHHHHHHLHPPIHQLISPKLLFTSFFFFV